MAVSYSIPATGTLRSNLPTPALTIDLNALEDNLACMARFFGDKPAKLRPHFKTHKCPILAHRQIRAGAIGMTCAKLGEAEVLVEVGISDPRGNSLVYYVVRDNLFCPFMKLDQH